MNYGLIGEHLGHSFSGLIHNALGNQEYLLQEVPKDQIDAFFQERPFRGINVTIPYKKTALEACDELSELAEKAGAVNCVINRNGRLYGHNTDCAGIEATLQTHQVDVRNKTVLVLGRGGAASAVTAVVEALGGNPVTVYRKESTDSILPKEAARQHPEAAVVINATPAGMYPHVDDQALDLSGFSRLEFVFDLVYNPLKTDLLLQAEELGVPCCGGLRMLVTQAVRAHELFFDVKVPDEQLEKILQDLTLRQSNIVLIGMSSCGKTTLGNSLAEAQSRKLLDLDAMVETDAGTSIPSLFEQEGETGFRDRETAAARNAGLQTGVVISCGGGIIERPENRKLLCRNGILVFLDRDPSLLVTEDDSRPMLRQGFQSLYERRLPVYREWADIILKNNGTPEQGLASLLSQLDAPVNPAGKETT